MQSPTAPGKDPDRPHRELADWLRIAFLALTLLFGALFVANRWHQLTAVLSRLNWPTVLGSVLLGALGTFLSVLGWRAVLVDLGGKLDVSAATRVFFVGQLGKYLPGSVWSVLAQAELAKQQNVPRKSALAASILGAALSIAAGLVLAAVLLPFGAHQAVRRYWWVIAIVPVFVLLLHPRVAGAALNRVLRLARRDPLEKSPTYAGTMRAVGWYSLGWLVLGLHAWLLVVGLGAAAGRSLPVTVGGFALAFCIGTLFIPAPAGAGVRDVALTVALRPVLSSTAALAAALASRVILAILDFVLAGLASVWVRRGRDDATSGAETVP